jgi:DNA-binding response OmpR family regulator
MAAILVIDDDPMLRQTVRRMLERAGHEVLEADDGKAGLLLLDKQRVHLVVTDIYMPGDDGIITIRRLRREWPAIPVITMSGGSSAGNLNAAALALGARFALSKPFTNAELMEVVRAILDSNRETPLA